MKNVLPSCLCFLYVLAATAAEPFKVGEALPTFAAKDQHDKPFELKPGVRLLLVAFDMSTGKKANSVLEKKGGDFLDQQGAVYVANIYGMPAIGRAFALPKMRKYPHRIVLADDENLLSRYPTQKGHVTILALDPTLKINGIKYWDPEKELSEDLLK